MKRSSLLFVAGFVAINIGGFGTLRAAADDDYDEQMKWAMEFSKIEETLANQPQQVQQQAQ